jgi:tetratricopeptide (TPR) repeat protein
MRQGMALVTYRSGAARDLVLRDLTLEFQANGGKVETLERGGCTAEDFVSRIAQSNADVLFVLDADRLLFGEDSRQSPFWVNFHRETIVGHAGVQIWWMLPNAAIRFGQELPDLSRFFLFREDLTDEVEVKRDTSLELQISPGESSTGDPNRAGDLLQRGLRAAASPNADPDRVWLELGIPAIDEFLRSGLPSEALETLRQLTGLVGPPEVALNRVSDRNHLGDAGRAFLTLSRLYREAGRRDDGLVAAENAVRIYRQLVQMRPETFLPNLAASLDTLAFRLSDLGRGEDALARAEDAVRIYRQLAQQSPDAFATDLATSLNNLGIRFSELGRFEEALAQAEEAVRIHRQLAQQGPDAFLPDLAMSLNNLAIRLSDLGRREEALAQAEEAVRLYRRGTQQRPGEFLPDLAMSLNSLATMLRDLGRREEALVRAEEAVRVYRQIAQRRPDAFLPDLAGTLNNLAVILSGLGRREEALVQAEEAVRICRELAQQRPAAFLPDLAQALAVFGTIIAERRPGEALEPLAEAFRLLIPLFSELPMAHGRLMQTISGVYLGAAKAANIDPDPTLLPPVIAILEKLNPSRHE